MIPIAEAVLAFGTALSTTITKALPSDEERLQRLKLHYPLLYFKTKMTIHRRAFRYMRHHREVSITEYVNFVGGGLTQEEKDALKNMLQKELDRINKK